MATGRSLDDLRKQVKLLDMEARRWKQAYVGAQARIEELESERARFIEHIASLKNTTYYVPTTINGSRQLCT